MSYASTSPALQNRELYPRFFRTISSDLAFNPARAALLTKYGWKRVATLHQNEPSGIFSQVCSKCCHLDKYQAGRFRRDFLGHFNKNV